MSAEQQTGADACLTASRDRLRLALALRAPIPHRASGAQPNTNTNANTLDSVLALQARLAGLAGLCNSVAKAAVTPLAQKHPWGLVAGAFVTGVVVVWVRPWAWVSPPATRRLSTGWPELLLSLLQHLRVPRN